MLQVRRGADRAEIYSVAFSPTAQWLAVSSDKGTVHVFSLKVNSGNVGSERSNSPPDTNPSAVAAGSSLSFIKGIMLVSVILLLNEILQLFYFIVEYKLASLDLSEFRMKLDWILFPV